MMGRWGPFPGGAAGLLWGLLAFALVVPPAMFGFAAWQGRSQVLASAEEQVEATVGVLREHALRLLDTHALALKRIDARIRGLDWDTIERSPELAQYLEGWGRDIGGDDTFWLTDADGRVRASSTGTPPQGLDVSDREYFTAQRERDAGTFVSVPFQRRSGRHDWAIGISRRRTGPDGRFDGVIHVGVNTDSLVKFWEGVMPHLPHVVPIVRDDGEVLVRYPMPPARRLKVPSDAPIMRAMAGAPEGVYTAPSGIDGVVRINAYKRIGAYPLTITLSVDQAAVLAGWRRNLAFYGSFALIGWIGLLAMTWRALQGARRKRAMVERLREEIARREQAEEGLRQAQRMEAVGQLTGGIAHDFNNLLQVITGGLEILDRAKSPERRQRLLDAMRQSASRGVGLTRQLLAFSRRQALQPEPVDLGHQVGGMRELLHRSLRGDVAVETRFPERLWPVMVDPAQLELALLNVVVNARDAMPGGGTITIGAENAPALHEDEIAGDFVRLWISDTGTGMTPEVLGRVFEPFFTTKEVGKGSGLGLSQVYGFARQSGGTVRMESAPGQGTTMSLFLPRAAQVSVPRPAEPDRRREGGPITPGRAVLLVEDDEEVAAMTGEMLGGLGYAVTRTAGASAALGALANGRKIDLLFSDIMMPGGMNGLELAWEVRRRQPGLAVLLTTGYAEALRDPVPPGVRVLPKPYQADALAAAIEGALAASSGGERRAAG